MGATVIADVDRDLPMKWMLIALVAFTIPLALLYQAIVSDWLVSIPMTLIMIVAGFLFVSVSGYLAGLVGSSNNPVSGITIATILFASVVLIVRSEEHTSELQSLMRISYAVFFLNKK